MKNISFSIIALVLVLASGASFAYSCPVDMKAIDTAMSSSLLSKEDKQKVKELRAKGEKLHEEGDHEASIKVLKQAKEMLGI